MVTLAPLIIKALPVVTPPVGWKNKVTSCGPVETSAQEPVIVCKPVIVYLLLPVSGGKYIVPPGTAPCVPFTASAIADVSAPSIGMPRLWYPPT